MQNDLTFPSWYQSTVGPGVSKTIISLAAGILPVINLILSANHINIIPSQGLNDTISFAVFLFFVANTAVGYIRSKSYLQAQVGALQAKLGSIAK